MTIRKPDSGHIRAKKRTPSTPLMATALSSAMLLAAAPLLAADTNAPAEGKKLKTVRVEAEAIAPVYKAEKASSPKQTQPLLDTPQTLVVVKKELFQQQSATTLSEALRNTPGITMQMGENGNTATGDSIFMRGFDTQGSIYVDGIRDLGSITRDTFNTEQVEIAKGPAGSDNGRGAASGYVNMSSKVANQEDAATGAVIGGTADYKRATLDVNRTLGESSALRVNLLKQDAGVDGRDKVESDFQGFAASLGLGLGTDTRTYINYLNMQQSGIPDGGIATIGLDGYYNAIFSSTGALAGETPERVDSENFYGSSRDYNDVNANMFTVRVEQDLAKDVVLRNTSRYGRTNQDQVLTGVNAITFTTPEDPSSWTLARSRQGKDISTQILTNQTNLTATFMTGGLQHELSSGVEFIYENQVSFGVGLPYTAADSATRVTQAPANLYNPSTGDLFQPVVRDGTKIDGEVTTYSLYALDTITFNPQWEMNLSLRADRFHANTTQITRQGTGADVPVGTYLGSEAHLVDELLSWKLGGVYKPVDDGSIYLVYANTELPPGGANLQLNTTNAVNNLNNPNLDPQKGTNLELGTKWNLLGDKLFFTAAVFNSSNDNEIATNPDGTSVQVGETQVKGIELGLVGAITEQWQISAGLAKMDSEIVRGNRTSANNGASNTEGGAVRFSPELTFTLWNSYTFGNGLMLGGGARFVDTQRNTSLTSEQALGGRTLYEIDDYWVLDAMASYPVNKNVSVQLNLMNLTDEDYVASFNNSGARYYPGAPLAARLGVNFAF